MVVILILAALEVVVVAGLVVDASLVGAVLLLFGMALDGLAWLAGSLLRMAPRMPSQ